MKKSDLQLTNIEVLIEKMEFSLKIDLQCLVGLKKGVFSENGGTFFKVWRLKWKKEGCYLIFSVTQICWNFSKITKYRNKSKLQNSEQK